MSHHQDDNHAFAEGQSPLPAALRAAVERLYSVFAAYPLHTLMESCPHCVDAAEQRKLGEQPLRFLSPDTLSRYAFKALTTWGTPKDFKHFLPRLFELLAIDPTWIDAEVLIGKLDLARWTDWPPAEQETVQEYLSALWQATLGQTSGRLRSDECLRAIGRAASDLYPYLLKWRQDTSSEALCQLADFVLDNQDSLWGTGMVRRAGLLPHQRTQVSRWLVDEPTLERLEQSFFADSEAPYASKLAAACDCLRGARLATS